MVYRTTTSLLQRMLLLSESDVRKCLDVTTCLAANRTALIAVATGDAIVPSRISMQYHPTSSSNNGSSAASSSGDWTLFKPASMLSSSVGQQQLQQTPPPPSTDKMGIKIVSVRANNPSNGHPLVPATILHLHPATGIVEAVLSSTYLTGIRTACGPALAIQAAGRPVHHLVVFGAGLQAEQHVRAIATATATTNNQCGDTDASTTMNICQIPKLTIVNRSADRAHRLAAQLQAEHYVKEASTILLSDTQGVTDALSTASVICTTTNTATPLWTTDVPLPRNCVVTGVGSYTPDMCEIPMHAVDQCSHIWIDTPEASTVGDLKDIPEDDKKKQVLLGDVLRRREGENSGGDGGEYPWKTGIILFKSVGTAIQDVLTADAAVQQARKQTIGTQVDMS